MSPRSIKAAVGGPRAIGRTLVSHLAVAALIAVSAAALTRLRGPEAARAIRRAFAEMTPLRMLVTVALLVFIAAAGSFAARDARVRNTVGRAGVIGRAVLAAAGAVPAVISLTVVVVLAAAFRIVLGAAETIPRLLGDELIYTDLAKSIAVHGKPLLRGDLHLGHSVLYPLFVSPAYALASDGASAFAAVKVMNSVTVALAAVPAYFLARRVVSHGWSLGVAALVVAVPWTVYSALTMTESLFYLLFTVFALLFVHMLELPTWRRQLAVLVVLAVLIGVRAQALALLVSVLLAIVFEARVQRSLIRAAERFWLTWLVVGTSIVGVTAAAMAGLPLPQDAYSALFDVHYSVPSLAKWAWWNLADYELALGVIAFAAFPLALLRLLRRNAPPAERALGLGSIALFAGLLASVAALSASPFGLDILHERSLFYLTPLVLVCFVHWLSSGLPRPTIPAVVVALVAVALAASLPSDLIVRTSDVEAPSMSPLRALGEIAHGIPVRYWAVALAIAGASALLLVRSAVGPVISVAIAFATATAQNDFFSPLTRSQDRALAWVDRALPGGATATLVHFDLPLDPVAPCASQAEYEQQLFVVWTEFFNTSVDRVMHVYGPVKADNVASRELFVEDGVLTDPILPFRSSYVVVDSRQRVVGTKLARFDGSRLRVPNVARASLTLWKVDPPIRLVPTTKLAPRPDGKRC